MIAQRLFDYRHDPKQLLLKTHPDQGGTNDEFIVIHKARDVLKDKLGPKWGENVHSVFEIECALGYDVADRMLTVKEVLTELNTQLVAVANVVPGAHIVNLEIHNPQFGFKREYLDDFLGWFIRDAKKWSDNNWQFVEFYTPLGTPRGNVPKNDKWQQRLYEKMNGHKTLLDFFGLDILQDEKKSVRRKKRSQVSNINHKCVKNNKYEMDLSTIDFKLTWFNSYMKTNDFKVYAKSTIGSYTKNISILLTQYPSWFSNYSNWHEGEDVFRSCFPDDEARHRNMSSAIRLFYQFLEEQKKTHRCVI